MYWSEKQRELLKFFFPAYWNYLLFLNQHLENSICQCWCGEDEGAQVALTTEIILWRLCGDNNGCGQCRECRQVLNEIHPDLLVVKKNTDQLNISIDAARKVNLFLSSRPVLGKSKIVYIKNAELLTTEANNALLKKFEELKNGFSLLCTTAHLNKIPETLRSRLVIFNLPPLKKSILRKYLHNQAENNLSSRVIVEFVDGYFQRLNYQTDREHLKNWREKIDFWQIFFKANLIEKENLIQNKIFFKRNSREEINGFLKCLINYLRTSAKDNVAFSKKLWHTLLLVESYQKMLAENVNPKLIFNNLLINIV